MESSLLYSQNLDTILGPISIYASQEYVVELNFHRTPENPNEITQKAIHELDLFFNKKITSFTIPLFISGSDFQQKVLQAITQIPFGSTITYAALSARIGNPLAIRAVARANAKNKLPIFIPCHRVVGKEGKLTGYIGGIEAKKTLLELENHLKLF